MPVTPSGGIVVPGSWLRSGPSLSLAAFTNATAITSANDSICSFVNVSFAWTVDPVEEAGELTDLPTTGDSFPPKPDNVLLTFGRLSELKLSAETFPCRLVRERLRARGDLLLLDMIDKRIDWIECN